MSSRQLPSSTSLVTSSLRTKLWKAWASVAYGMSCLCRSNFPAANRPRDGTSDLCSSLTTVDFPMPAYPETSTSSGVPDAATRCNDTCSATISLSRPYGVSGTSSRSGMSCSPSGKFSMLRCASHCPRQCRIVLEAERSLIALLGVLCQQLHDECGDYGRQPWYPFAWSRSIPGDMAVHPLHRLGGSER